MDDPWETEMREFEVLVKFPACLQVLLMEELTIKKQAEEGSKAGRAPRQYTVGQAGSGGPAKQTRVTC